LFPVSKLHSSEVNKDQQNQIPIHLSYLLGLYLLSSSSSVSLRIVMTLTGGLGVSGMMIG
jgi:hypothetical protein